MLMAMYNEKLIISPYSILGQADKWELGRAGFYCLIDCNTSNYIFVKTCSGIII